MSAYLRGWVEALGEAAVWSERRVLDAAWLPAGRIHADGEAGARSLLSAIASSTIGIAGMTFSITVAALSLASGQMGPRLLRNFTRGAGNQFALGTFAYALVVLRTVRTLDETPFAPQAGVTGALLLALLCVGTLIWFVHHVASGINVETVIDLVHEDLRAAIVRLTLDRPAPIPSSAPPRGGAPATVRESGYLHALDETALADWAEKQGATVVLLVRTGDYVFPGAPEAEVFPGTQAGATPIRAALSLGPIRAAAQDFEFAIRQFVEVAVRALSDGINDPLTAIDVLDRLGAVLCELAPRHLSSGAEPRSGQCCIAARRTTTGCATRCSIASGRTLPGRPGRSSAAGGAHGRAGRRSPARAAGRATPTSRSRRDGRA